jgi:hypothetical protein
MGSWKRNNIFVHKFRGIVVFTCVFRLVGFKFLTRDFERIIHLFKYSTSKIILWDHGKEITYFTNYLTLANISSEQTQKLGDLHSLNQTPYKV